MNSEISLQYSPKPLKSMPLTSDMINHHMALLKTNPHKITKHSYEHSASSQKASANIKKNMIKKRAKGESSSLVLKNISPYDLEVYNLSNDLPNSEFGKHFQDYQSHIDHQDKENLFPGKVPSIENFQEILGVTNQSKSAITNKAIENPSSRQTMSPESESQEKTKKLNQFSTYKIIHDDSDCQSLLTENIESRKCPITPQPRTTRHSSQENDFSDRETVEGSVSCHSENMASQTKFPKGSMRVPFTDSKGNFWNSQENSCCTTLDCDEALGYNQSASILEKKEDSVQDVSEFEQDFSFFSNTEHQNEELAISLSEKKQKKVKTIEEELADFRPQMNPCAFDSETINYLIVRENDYSPDLHYLEKHQNQINWSMRAILFDWMMEVCMEFGLKRETYHYSINYVDRYMSTVKNIQKSELQLIGVTALYMAAKVEVNFFIDFCLKKL